MTKRLHRYYNTHDLHFITCSCFHRQPQLDTPERRDLFLSILEEARQKYCFVVHGYVVMPEHFHLLITEPEVGDPSVVMKVLKERFTKKLRAKRVKDEGAPLIAEGAPLIAPFAMSGIPRGTSRPEPPKIWQKRFYDFNVWTEQKHIEKLRYIHRNPVQRGLVEKPEQWKWSSFRAYLFGETGPVRANFQEWALEIKNRPAQSFGGVGNPLIRRGCAPSRAFREGALLPTARIDHTRLWPLTRTF
ncbi:MAG: transposase [Terriglobales bacterium]